MCAKEKEEVTNKVIVLDFDGCCTSIESGTHFMLLDDLTYKPCKTLVDRVKNLCIETGAKVMLSTNWRKFKSGQCYVYRGIKFKNQIPKLKRMLKGYLIDDLLYEPGLRKAECLILWLEDHPEYKDNFVIFDDADYERYGDTTDYGICKRFIQVDPNVGISEADIVQAKNILTK